MIYVMIGGPATGKGTRSQILADSLNIPHISTGDILREESRNNLDMKAKLSRGELISDDVITNLLYKRLSQKDCDNGFVLDGYPRTLNQAKLLDELLNKLNKKITLVVELLASDELVFRRILERQSCPKCGKMYGLDFPPKVKGICDVCGAKLVTRSDDTKETLQKRIDVYKKNAEPIIEYYKNEGLLRSLDSSGHPERIVNEVK